jgi:uncharacterized protein involved in response to NO
MSSFLFEKTRKAYLVFYPLAALWAVFAIPLWVAQYSGISDLGITSNLHAHEMIFGFALAVITGFLLNGCKQYELILLSLLWIAGRFAALTIPDVHLLNGLLHIGFPIYLAWLAAVPLFKNAKSWRNLAFAPILTAFTIGELVYLVDPERGLLLGLNLICAMVFMMGGRVVTAVTNGFIQRMDDHLKPGAQSYWEAKGFFALLALMIGDLLNTWAISMGGAVALIFILSMRLYRWEPWRLWKNPQVLWLHIGFTWLLVGIILRTIGFMYGYPFSILGIHTITIAALGTLTITIMTRTTQQRLRNPMDAPKAMLYALGFINVAIFGRIAMELATENWFWSALSSVSYAQAYLVFLIWLILAVRKT